MVLIKAILLLLLGIVGIAALLIIVSGVTLAAIFGDALIWILRIILAVIIIKLLFEFVIK